MSFQNQPIQKKSFIQNIIDFWNKGRREKIALLSVVVVLFVCCCVAVFSNNDGNSASTVPTLDANAAATSAVETAWIAVTQTAIAGASPTPSSTPLPTDTPIPTATSTPLPQPVVLTGAGDSIVNVDWQGAGIMHLKHVGGSNFIVENFDANNNQLDLLVNTIGNYDGIVPLDFLDSEDTVRLQITAGGSWEITISPLLSARIFELPTTITGIGDDVVILKGGTPDIIKADASQANSNFIVYAYSGSGADLIFNEIAPYTGSVLLPSDTVLLVIKASGPWSLEITTR